MLPFRDLLLTDREAVEWAFRAQNCNLCDYSFAELYMWRHHYHPQICFYDGFLLIWMQTFPDRHQFCYPPIGSGNFEAALNALVADSEERGRDFHMSIIPEALIPRIEAALPHRFTFSDNRDWYDYFYETQTLADLRGSALQPKRNQINRFKKAYENRWSYDPISPANFAEAVTCNNLWQHLHSEASDEEAIVDETQALLTALDHFNCLHLFGGVLRVDGEVAAFSFGYRVTSDTVVVPFEKADHRIQGASQMINQLFAQTFCTDNGIRYINREDDLGIAGLRKAKLSYRPAFFGKKFQALPIGKENHP